MIEACVPEEKRAELTEQLLEEDKGLAGRLGGGVIGEAFGVTFTLGLGWGRAYFFGRSFTLHNVIGITDNTCPLLRCGFRVIRTNRISSRRERTRGTGNLQALP